MHTDEVHSSATSADIPRANELWRMRSGMLACLLVILAEGFLPQARAQTIVPVVTSTERFVAFMDGRFEELEPRPPKALHHLGDRLAYLTEAGDLKLCTEGKVVVLDHGADLTPKRAGAFLVWKHGNELRMAQEEGTKTLSKNAGEFSVSDSLIAWHDIGDAVLNVYWRGRSFPIADIEKGSEAPQWQCGPNTLVFYDRSIRRAMLFYRGTVKMLADSIDYARVSTGSDVVAYFDDKDDRFKVFDHGRLTPLEEFPPISFKAGAGIIGYVSNGGRFRCRVHGSTIDLSNAMPTEYWVQDSVLLYVENGKWRTVGENGPETIENYVPEQWAVHGSRVLYLDLNREPRMYRLGAREELSHDTGVKALGLFGDAVTWRDQLGNSRVWWRGRIYEY
jgi:hypothetical protein